MKQHFHSLYKYNHWCNEQMITLIEAHHDAFTERAQTLMSHILNAHHIWNNRLQRIDRIYGVWDLHAIKDLSKINTENFEASTYILERFDYEYLLNFTNTKNENHISRVKDILYHIINHSTYHRGQLMTELKSQGATPVTLDFTFYKENH